MPIELDPLTGDVWYYGNRARISTKLSAAAISVIWDRDDDNAEDAGLMVADGLEADATINRKLKSLGVTATPVDLVAHADIAESLASASTYLTIWNGMNARGLETVKNRLGNELAAQMSGYKDYAEEILDEIAVDLLYGNGTTVSAVQAIVPTCEQGCGVTVRGGPVYP
jgi:hypothetical protein